MGIRGSVLPRCTLCGLQEALCLCADLPRLPCATKVVLFQHQLDAARPSNTGRLVVAMLEGAEAVIHGRPASAEHWEPPAGSRPLTLHPDGRPLRPEDRGACLLVPDGTWRQTRRMAQRVKWLRESEHVSVTPVSAQRPVLRRRASPERVGTLEAVAAAMAVVQSLETCEAMLTVHAELVRRHLAVRNTRRGDVDARRCDP